jgi:two-component system chemotaxis response regulator CheB
VGVLLSGMGSDGAIGLWKMKEQGSLTLVQDQESSVVFGMPGEAIKLNAETYILKPGEIADFLNTMER